MKDVAWAPSVKEDLSTASDQIRTVMGFALFEVQMGRKPMNAVLMKGELRDVIEIRENDSAGTYRLMYTVKLGDVVYVLDFFQKRSTTGIATPKVDLERILRRLKKAREDHAPR